ncbi:hypothetical protein PV646_20515 [Streptomyces sp. ID05-26A]|nr:hypothetical protein [Streptomyces sp. ID05-26A]
MRSSSRASTAQDAEEAPLTRGASRTPVCASVLERTCLGELMTAVAQGDRTAFGRVYDLLSVPFHRLVLISVRTEGGQADRETAVEQAALDAWTGVWRDAPQLLLHSRRPLTSADAVAWIKNKIIGSLAAQARHG